MVHILPGRPAGKPDQMSPIHAAVPAHLDINRLVLLDHGLLHSADLNGPESLHPPIPVRVGELGVKRQHIEDGLHVMIRAGLAEMSPEDSGIEFWASESSESFLKLLESEYEIGRASCRERGAREGGG